VGTSPPFRRTLLRISNLVYHHCAKIWDLLLPIGHSTVTTPPTCFQRPRPCDGTVDSFGSCPPSRLARHSSLGRWLNPFFTPPAGKSERGPEPRQSVWSRHFFSSPFLNTAPPLVTCPATLTDTSLRFLARAMRPIGSVQGDGLKAEIPAKCGLFPPPLPQAFFRRTSRASGTPPDHHDRCRE